MPFWSTTHAASSPSSRSRREALCGQSFGDGIALSAGFTATVNADLRVGALEETITVSGQSNLVDVQNTCEQTAVPRDVIDALPIAKSAQNFATFVPGVVALSQDVGGFGGRPDSRPADPWKSTD